MNATRREIKPKKHTVNQLREVLDYNPETGDFHWKEDGRKAGNTNARGYTAIWYQAEQYSAHRLAWEWVNGEAPKGDIDHINEVKSDNRISNLRVATRSENMFNRGKNPNNTSGFKGVAFCKQTGRWQAQITINRKTIKIGRYDTPELASAAYNERAKKERGEFAKC